MNLDNSCFCLDDPLKQEGALSMTSCCCGSDLLCFPSCVFDLFSNLCWSGVTWMSFMVTGVSRHINGIKSYQKLRLDAVNTKQSTKCIKNV